MPQPPRSLMDGAVYHVLTRGNNGLPVFHEAADYQRYLQLVATRLRQHHIKVYHFALMPNHVHLVLDVARGPALSEAMHDISLTYALFYKRRYQYRGHLWQGRFKSLLIDQDRYLMACGRYVELNPVKAGLVSEPADYAWTSYRTYADGLDNPLIAPNPLYETLGATPRARQESYRQFTLDGLRPSTPSARDGPRLFGGPSKPHSAQLFSAPGLGRKPGRPSKPAAATQTAPAALEKGAAPIFRGRG